MDGESWLSYVALWRLSLAPCWGTPSSLETEPLGCLPCRSSIVLHVVVIISESAACPRRMSIVLLKRDLRKSSRETLA
eukprot:5560933-Amphidinium_carterae.1